MARSLHSSRSITITRLQSLRGLVQAADGNFYGAAFLGRHERPWRDVQARDQRRAHHAVLFTGSDGANPYAGLAQGADGMLYGTTFYGGTNVMAPFLR